METICNLEVIRLFQIGYKEGAYDGRQSVFQQGFDTGYENGFRNAFRLGAEIGRLNAATDIANKGRSGTSEAPSVSPAATDLALKRPTRGQCVVCTDQSLMNEKINAVIDRQQRHMNKISSTLDTRYPPLPQNT